MKTVLKKRFLSAYFFYQRLRLRVKKILIPDRSYVRKKFKRNFGREPDLDNPATYNEHISKILLEFTDPLAASCVDKYSVRDYVKTRIGEQYLNELYGLYSSCRQVRKAFDGFPKSFVLKATHGCDWNYICRNKSDVQWSELRPIMNHWMKSNFYYAQRERIYKNIQPRILCEKYLEDASGSLMDYKIHCFSGEPGFINVMIDRFSNMKLNTYDTDWNFMDISFGNHYPNDKNMVIQKPQKLDELIEISKVLSRPFPYVRCDFYIVDDQIIFGELTFTPGNGTYGFSESEDRFLGKFFTAPNKEAIL